MSKSTTECRKGCDVYKDWCKLEARNAELEATVARLSSRSIEDMHFRIAELEKVIQDAGDNEVLTYYKRCLDATATIKELEAELAKHEWISVEEAVEITTYQCCYKDGEGFVLGSKSPSGNWLSAYGYIMTKPDLIKPITLPEPKKEVKQ